jgi:hypothetical protein
MPGTPPVLKDADVAKVGQEGLLKFNSLCEMVEDSAKEETGSTVENYLRTWCRPGWNARLAGNNK